MKCVYFGAKIRIYLDPFYENAKTRLICLNFLVAKGMTDAAKKVTQALAA